MLALVTGLSAVAITCFIPSEVVSHPGTRSQVFWLGGGGFALVVLSVIYGGPALWSVGKNALVWFQYGLDSLPFIGTQ